jgi:hypothetical protein
VSVPIPEQWKPENQDEAVKGVRVNQYGQAVNDAGEVVAGPGQRTTEQAEQPAGEEATKTGEGRRTRKSAE